MCYPAEFGCDRSNSTSVIKEIHLKNLTTCFSPFEVTQGHRNRHVSIRHLWLPLTYHYNHGPTPYHFRDKRRFQSKIAIVSHTCIFNPTLGIAYGHSGSKKTRMVELPGRERSLTIASAIWIQYTNVSVGQTDGHTDTGRQQIPHLRLASRGKKNDVLQ